MKNIHALFISGVLAAGIIALLPSTTAAAITQSLSMGSNGSDVHELQTYLASDATLYPEALITGYYGSLTVAAVQRFQCRENIVCSGTPETTGYGAVGPQTRARLNALMGTTTGGSTTGDVSAPIMSAETVTPSTGGAQITWTTNESARGRVMYGTVWPFLYATAPSLAEPSTSTTHAITLSGLLSNRMYYYVRESVDTAGNVQWTTAKTFTTM